MKTNEYSKQLGFAAAMLANILWGTSFLASKYTLIQWNPFTASALRFVVASFFIFGLAKILGKPIQKLDRKSFLGVSLISLSSFVALYPLQLSGLQSISSSLSSVLMLTSPLFVIGFAPFILGEKVTPYKILAIFLGIAGGTILMTPSLGMANQSIDFQGFALTILASVSLAASVIVTRKTSPKMDTWSLTFWSMAIGAVGLTAMTLFVEKDYSKLVSYGNTESLLALIYLAIVCSVLCFFLWNFALKLSPAKDLATTMHIKTPIAIAVGMLLGRESFTVSMAAGFLLVMFGVLVSQWRSNA